MPELEVLEAHVPVRTSRLVREEGAATTRLAPIATWFSGPVFSRARDIFAANTTELLDRSEDPSKMIRMIILEMEETLVDVRASAARSIADVKEIRRALNRTPERKRVGFGAAAGEDHIARLRAGKRGDLIARAFDHGARSATSRRRRRS